jgi:hypothetical protein
MIVGMLTRKILLYASLVVLVASGVGFAYLRTRAHGVKRWLPLGVGALALFATIWIFKHDTEVILVTDIEGGPLAERKVNIGTDAFTRAPGTGELDSPIGMETSWIVNRSSHAVRLESVPYGYGEPSSTEVPPNTALETFGTVDYLGPRHKPPNQIVSDSRIGTDTRLWLTW